MGMFFGCRHTWEVKSDQIMPSPMQVLAKETPGFAERVRKADWPMFVQTHVVVMACARCGRVDKTITSNPDPFRND